MLVAVQLSVPGSYLPPVFKNVGPSKSAPDDHFAAGPDCTVLRSCRRCVGRAGGCPTIRIGIVSPAGGISCVVDDHFAAGPRCRATPSGRVGGASGCPTIGVGIVSPAGVTPPPQTIISLPVQTAAETRGEGASVVLVAVQLSVSGSYLPPVFKKLKPSNPPQTIISLPVQAAVLLTRGEGALVVLVAVQLSVLGSYLPPVLGKRPGRCRPRRSFRCRSRPAGTRLVRKVRWSCWWPSNYPCWDYICRQCSNWWCH